MGPVARWSAAFLATSAMASMLALSTCQSPAPVEAKPVVARDPSKVSEVEVELILNKIHEGDLHAVKGDLVQARRAWDEARRLGEGLWPIHEGLGDSYSRQKLHREAIGEYRTAEALVPEKHAPLRRSIVYKRAEALRAAGQSAEAIKAYLELGDPAQVGSKIAALVDGGNAALAVRLISEHAEVLDPRFYLVLSQVETKLGHSGPAAEALAKFTIAVMPWEENYNRTAVQALREAGKYDLALEVCRAWVKSTPQALEAYVQMGDLERERGREKEALVAYTSIVDVRAGDAKAHRLLGDIFRKMNRREDAMSQYEAAKKARPEDPETYGLLAALYQENGEVAKFEGTVLEATRRFGTATPLRNMLVANYEGRIRQLRAEGKPDEVKALRRKLAELNVAEAGLFDLKIIMTWDVESDVDLDVFEPGGEHIEHSHPHSKAGGHYYVDNTSGFGPETYTIPKVAPGTYRIGAHLHGDRKSRVKFVVILYEDSPLEERREETLILEKAPDVRYIRDVVLSR
jgi:tetratricopeptide (TPR) repeat protein